VFFKELKKINRKVVMLRKKAYRKLGLSDKSFLPFTSSAKTKEFNKPSCLPVHRFRSVRLGHLITIAALQNPELQA